MATDADARAAGFATPAGTELISGGDDAIRQNARAAVELHTLATRWQAQPLTAGNATTQPLGAYTIADPATVTGLPSGAGPGVLERQEGLDQYVTAEPAATLWERRKIGGLWQPWAIARREIITPYALTRPQAALTETTTSRSVRIPFTVPAPVRRWRVVIRNINYRTNTKYPGAVTLESVNVGGQARDVDGTRTSSFAPTQSFPSGLRTLVTSAAVADMGEGWSSGWSTDPLLPGTDYLLSYGYLTNGQDVQVSMAGGWQTNGNPGNAALLTDSTAAVATRLPFDVCLELVTADDVMTEVVIGDSIAAGSNATYPVQEAPARTAAPSARRISRLHTFGGAAMGEWIGTNWGDPASIKWQEITTAGRAGRAVIALGSNDIHAGLDLTTLQANFRSLLALVRSRISADVIACTVTPRTAWAGTGKESVRVAFNDWLRSLPEGLAGVADTARAVEDGTGHAPRTDMVTADGIHFNSAGSAALAAALASPRATPLDPAARLDALERDTGWRRLATTYPSTSRTGGTVSVKRRRDKIRMRFVDVTVPDGSGAALVVHISELPLGFTAPTVGTVATVGNTTGNAHLNYLRANGSWWWVKSEPTTTPSLNRASVSLSGEIEWTTDDPWPSTLPGSPA